MSLFNKIRRFLLWGLSVKEQTGFLTVNAEEGFFTIDLPFDPVDVDAEFLDESCPPSCAPVASDTCYAEKGDYSITVFWEVSGERKIRWTAAHRVL